MKLVETHQIRKGHKLYKFIDDLSFKSKSIYNMANYLIRQEFINNSNYKNYNSIDKELNFSYSDTYKLLPSKSTQGILKVLDRNWKSFFKSIKDYKSNLTKYKARPKLPKYKDKEKGRNIVVLTNQQFRIKDGVFYFLNSLTKDLDFKPIKTKIPEEAKLKETRFVPRTDYYKLEIVYEMSVVSDELKDTQGFSKKTGEIVDLDLNGCLSIDLGLNNFCSVSSNVGIGSYIINGKVLKSINQWVNKLQSLGFSQSKKNKHWLKRHNRLEHLFHQMSNYLIDLALSKGCKTLVVGYNEEWKQSINLGRKTNQSFVQIPFYRFLNILEYKCGIANLNLVKQEESYTSKCSALDGEEVKKQETYAGKRVKRGLFKTAKGFLINADVNGSLNIMRKYLGEVFKLDQVEGFVVNPYKISFLTN